ncbi:MAG: rod shape-determining protein RodA [Alphaproteobacteria bacterium]|nr:rod shape-determining protein RodA [Alphaproteobacteria bacterium]
MSASTRISRPFGYRLMHLHWPLIMLIGMLSGLGFLILYSAAGGNMDPWTSRQMLRFALGFVLMLIVALVPLQTLMRYAYVLYGAAVLMLIVVELFGHMGMGAQRWVKVGFVNLQPSELMKLCLVLALARYFHGLSPQEVNRPLLLVVPMLLIAVPVVLILKQPNLGTATITAGVAVAVLFAAGLTYWVYIIGIVGGAAAVPVLYHFLHDYQKRRVDTFLDPESDPLGAGYNILQSKIAIGSGGLFGKGFMEGSQSQLNFLPEKETDFIFTMFAEEFGFAGGMTVILLYVALIGASILFAVTSRNQFGRLIAIGVATMFFLHMFINMAMVMGLIPVVGVPLPFLSYGGTILIAAMIAVGLLLNVHANRFLVMGRGGL